jgi:predicted O-linked N-acetylglucosamine transferase (SPINDLY family)
VQVTWLGYPDTTGLETMDYRLTDALADPPGTTEHLHTEQLVRLPDGAWCFHPRADAPAVSTGPVAHTGHVTFGCFNAQPKITTPLLQLWADLLRGVPGARLFLKNRSLSDAATQQRLRTVLADCGIAPERLQLAGYAPRPDEHLAAYGRVDIALDTFPYHGTTTTCEALWMGVPVVTLAGKTHASRVGVSLLSRVGLTELVAETAEDYVRLATELASDLPRLAELRRTLRPRMAASPLTDAPRFARAIEAAYRDMWRAWCEKQPSNFPAS